MRSHLSRTSLIAFIAILAVCVCAGVAIHAVRHADQYTSGQHDFNLYALVPHDATVVVETDCMGALIQDIDHMPCSQDGHYLYVSDLFVLLKAYYYTLMEQAPHGLSQQMNRMLLSFHAPDSPRSQVLYCSLGPGDLELMQAFVDQYVAPGRAPQTSRYQGVTLSHYPMADGGTLTAYYTSRFLVISLQQSLVEAVVDAYRTRQSLMQWPNFQSMHPVRELGAQATVYVRMKSIDMGQAPTGEPTSSSRRHRLPPVGSWAEFSLRLSDEGIYCSGISHEPDTVHTFIGMLGRQDQQAGFPQGQLPSTTFFCSHIALTDRTAFRELAYVVDTLGHEPPSVLSQDDGEWIDLVADLSDGELMTCLFLSPHGGEARVGALMSVPVNDEAEAEARLQAHQGNAAAGSASRYPYTRLYQGRLLLATEASTIDAYVRMVEAGDVVESVPQYQEALARLSPMYQFLFLADMEAVTQLPVGRYVQTIPALFFRHARFFRHFLVAVQLTTHEGTVSPNVVLLYRGD